MLCHRGVRVSLALLAMGIATMSRPAQSGAAERETATLDFHTDPGLAECGDEAEFRNRVALRLGYDPFVADAPLHVSVRVSPEGSRVSSSTVFARENRELGKRVLREDRRRCSVLIDSVAAAVAIAIDPLHSPDHRPGDQPPAPKASAASAPPQESPTPQPSTDRAEKPPVPPAPASPSTPWSPFVAANFVMGFGVAPGVTLGAEGAFGLRHGAGSYALEGRAEVTPSAVSLTPLDRVHSTVFSGALVPCIHASVVAFCGVFRAGSIQSTALDVSRPTLETAFIGAVALRIGVAIPVGSSFSFRGAAEGGLPLSRTSYVINGAVVWTPPPITGSVQFGAAWTFR